MGEGGVRKRRFIQYVHLGKGDKDIHPSVVPLPHTPMVIVSAPVSPARSPDKLFFFYIPGSQPFLSEHEIPRKIPIVGVSIVSIVCHSVSLQYPHFCLAGRLQMHRGIFLWHTSPLVQETGQWLLVAHQFSTRFSERQREINLSIRFQKR